MLVNKWLKSGKTQQEIRKALKIRQADVSEIKWVIEAFGMDFINRLDPKVPFAPLKRFSRLCLMEKYQTDQGVETPALLFLESLRNGTGEITEDMLDSFGEKAKTRWWEKTTLLTLAHHQQFARTHPEFAALLESVINFKSLEEWLLAQPNPGAKVSIKKQ